jgi:predicted flap endonuclease-1-like 5' DNA nuclease
LKNPPVFISLLGFFALLAGFAYVFVGLRVIGFDWFGALGDLPAFEHVGLWGWLAVATGAIWILVALGLWTLQPWARLFALFMAGFALLEAVIAMFQFTGSGIGFAMALMPALIIWYLSTADVKAVFAEGDEPAPAPSPAPAAAAPVAFAAAATPAPAAPAPAPVAAAAVVAAAASPAPAEEPVAAPIMAAAAPAPETGPAAHHMNIEDVEGIGPAYAEKLAAIGIATTSDLLDAGAKPYARERIAEQTGISSKLIRDWVNKVDLMRVPGVGPQYSDLLEAAGVDSPAELAQRNPTNLAITVQEVVAERPGIVRRIPTESEIAAWVQAASTLDSAVEH